MVMGIGLLAWSIAKASREGQVDHGACLAWLASIVILSSSLKAATQDDLVRLALDSVALSLTKGAAVRTADETLWRFVTKKPPVLLDRGLARRLSGEGGDGRSCRSTNPLEWVQDPSKLGMGDKGYSAALRYPSDWVRKT